VSRLTDRGSKDQSRRAPLTGKELGRYANFFQIGHNAFEFLIEFGQQDGGIHTRIDVSPRHAQILSDLLTKTLREHDDIFGHASASELEKKI
jgi:uncharacterized protein DUF3467